MPDESRNGPVAVRAAGRMAKRKAATPTNASQIMAIDS